MLMLTRNFSSARRCVCVSPSAARQDHAWVSYNSSKSAVLQMARSMACELGPRSIRVNSLSPGHIYTKCVRHTCRFLYTPDHGLTVCFLTLVLHRRFILRSDFEHS